MLSRRALIAGGLAAALAACAPRAEPEAAPTTRPTRPPVRPARTASPRVERHARAETSTAQRRFEPPPGEVLLEAKRLAARVAIALTTYGTDERPVDVAARALGADIDPQAAPALTDALAVATVTAPLVVPRTRSSSRVVYPQLGGESAAQDACAVLIVVEQLMAAPDARALVTRTIDVRLRHHQRGWAVEQIASIGGDPVPRPPDLSPTAVAVLDDRRIQLPDSARWDIHARRIDERLLATMQVMAGLSPFAVTCLQSGHPPQVFGTARTSNHTAGRALDVWRVGDLPVVAQQAPDSPARRFHQALLDLGAAQELGGPWDLDGSGRRSFTDRAVHKDHLHVAFFQR